MAEDLQARVEELEAEVHAARTRAATLAAENHELRADVDRRGHALAEALEQQIATAEVLRVIASEPTDRRRVLQSIADIALRLCVSTIITIRIQDGDDYVELARAGRSPRAPGQADW